MWIPPSHIETLIRQISDIYTVVAWLKQAPFIYKIWRKTIETIDIMRFRSWTCLPEKLKGYLVWFHLRMLLELNMKIVSIEKKNRSRFKPIYQS